MNRGISQDTVTGSAEPSRSGITSSSNKAKITSFIFLFEVTKRQIEKIENKGDLLFYDFKKLHYKKIVLKRPIKANKIDLNINYQVKGKSTRYDIYI